MKSDLSKKKIKLINKKRSLLAEKKAEYDEANEEVRKLNGWTEKRDVLTRECHKIETEIKELLTDDLRVDIFKHA